MFIQHTVRMAQIFEVYGEQEDHIRQTNDHLYGLQFIHHFFNPVSLFSIHNATFNSFYTFECSLGVHLQAISMLKNILRAIKCGNQVAFPLRLAINISVTTNKDKRELTVEGNEVFL